MNKITKRRLAALELGSALMVASSGAYAFAAGTAAGLEIATIVTDVVPVGTAVVTISVFIYGYRVIRKML
jgi:hypothetical protein